jgi:hypothetical protein
MRQAHLKNFARLYFQRRLQFAKVTGASSSLELDKNRAKHIAIGICIVVLLHVKPLAILHEATV